MKQSASILARTIFVSLTAASTIVAVAACKGDKGTPAASGPTDTADTTPKEGSMANKSTDPGTPEATPGHGGAATPQPDPGAPAQPTAGIKGEPLAPGAPAPDFTGKTFDGRTITLHELKGAPVVVYFYPKDETPGCTLEAQEFATELPDLTSAGATVIGISMDSLDSHREFAASHNLTFPLLSDPDGAIAARYGVSTEGGHARRVTFVIGPDGKIARTFPQVSVKGHAAEVTAVIKGLPKK
jgi:thioredoxin-dependent peroxiredoxin